MRWEEVRDEIESVLRKNGVSSCREIAEAVTDYLGFKETRHLFMFSGAGYACQHPIIERFQGMLFRCSLPRGADLAYSDYLLRFGDGVKYYWVSDDGSFELAEGSEIT